MLDRQFMLACGVLGAVDTGLVLAISHYAGKESAGIASVALVALFTAILKQFEKLRFVRAAEAEGEVVTVPRLNLWLLLLGFVVFLGVFALMSLLATWGIVGYLFRIRHESMATIVPAATILLSTKAAEWAAIVLIGLTHLVSGFLVTKVGKTRSYAYAMVSSCIESVAIFWLLPAIVSVALAPEPRLQTFFTGTPGISAAKPALAFVFAAMIGARLAFRRRDAMEHRAPVLVEGPVA